ncbi:alpha-2-macroglobulin family protein [Roseomonas sp. OT10]|uniref:alpha-2-macroglobulin family protein n=1 Tax=Roseomonas cutis TaxID=2897332 RepID=UPI001E5AB4C1|nr:alpha-2-macroglobulin [Roseomonas sp. OT10]UFN50751.1 alpha-2-macroglobulin family protein [Roseomonas sp. OT10]
MRLAPLLAALALLLVPSFAPAQTPFTPPGLERDASGYARDLTRRYPAGAAPALRTQAEASARAAEARGDWSAAAAAWEQRVGMPDAQPEHWLFLAQAQMRRTPPDPNRALQAAWRNFSLVEAGAAEIPSLAVMAQAFQALNNWPQAVGALEAITERAPSDTKARDALAQARRAAGLLVRQVRTEPEADPARACITFFGSLSPTLRPGDWVRADPPVPNLAIQRDGQAICVAGLPWGQTTRLTLRAGLPGQDGATLRDNTPVAISMPDRAARIAFDGSRYLLPRGQAARVGIATVNISTLKLRLVRVTERNLIPFGRDNPLGDALSRWSASDVPESWGRVIWEGTAEVPNFRRNVLNRVVLPLPEALTASGPGLHVLLAQEAGAGDRGDDTAAGLQIIATDLGLTAWRSPAGLAAQIRSLQSATPRAGVKVALMARNNDVLAEATTGEDGLVRFDGPLLRGEGPMAPVALHARSGEGPGEDLVSLRLDAAAFDLSDRGAEGRPHPGPLDAFLWLDRGIYRPGEVVNLGLLLRDAAGQPKDVPVRLRLVRPNGQVAAEAVPERGPDGSVLWPVRLSPGAAVGEWAIEARIEPDQPPIGRAGFRVDAFVPERLDLSFGPAPGPLVPGTPLSLPVAARFLYGAPAADLTGELSGRLVLDPQPFAVAGDGGTRSPWDGWRFGLAEEPLTDGTALEGSVTLNAEGKGNVEVTLPRLPDVTRPLRAEMTLTLADPNGRASRAALSVPVRGTGNYIAIRPAFSGGSVDANAEAAFDVALVSPEGRALAGSLRARLVRERPDWRIVTRGGRARYETVWRDEPVDSVTLTTRAGDGADVTGTPARLARSLPFGRYRLEVTQPDSLAIAAIRFRSGWVGSDSLDVPDKVDVSAGRPSYGAGETARIHVAAPFAGRASVAVLTDRLVSLREVEIAEGGSEVEVPVDSAWGPGAYVAVTVFRPGSAAEGRPRRALGLAWVALDPAPRRLEVAIEAPDLLRPRQRVEIPVRVAAAGGGAVTGAWLTLAAVDEGVLRITRFPNPDPVGHFLGRRRLGADIRDDYGRLIPPPEGELAALRQGGDGNADLAGVTPPQRVVSLFSGRVEIGPDGLARVPLDLPDFAGELRLMAVAWSGPRIGAAAKAVTVRDPVVAEALLPRFLAPGDAARLPVLLHNVELPPGEVAATVTVEGPLALDGPARLAASLGTGARAQPFATLRATGGGEGVIRVAVTGPDGFAARRESRITIRSSRPSLVDVAVSDLAPNVDTRLSPDLGRFVPGTAGARARWGQPVRYDAEALLQAALDFPLACAEQAATKVMALAAAPPDVLPAETQAQRMAAAIGSLLDKQRWDGAFSLWSSNGEPGFWVSAYAVEALLRAKAAGATVPEGALSAALDDLARRAEETTPDSPEERADQAYRLHVLALANRPLPGATRRLAEQMDQMPTPLARAQLGAALARIGDAPRAEAAFTGALEAGGRRWWYHDYGSAMRDQLAVTLLLRESGVLAARLPAQLARLPGARELTPEGSSTQEQAWAVALAAALGQDGTPARISLDGRALPPARVVSATLDQAVVVRNTGPRPVIQSVTTTGLPQQPLPAARAGMRISRKFLTLQGADVNLDDLRQNTDFVLLVEARAETGESHRALVQQGLPAGWEITSRLPSGDVPGMGFLGTLTEPAMTAALDDRFAVAAELTPTNAVARFAVVLRAVTPGGFELPGAQVQDMYRPGVFARQNTGRITVLPPP